MAFPRPPKQYLAYTDDGTSVHIIRELILRYLFRLHPSLLPAPLQHRPLLLRALLTSRTLPTLSIVCPYTAVATGTAPPPPLPVAGEYTTFGQTMELAGMD